MIRKLIFFLPAVLLTCAVYAQAPVCRNLVFEGAGMRGIAYAGVLGELEKAHYLDSVQNIGGTSAGGITALTYALGYKAEEIAQLINSTNFNDFNDGRFIFAGGIYRMSKNFGWYQGDAFLHWIEKVIATKTGNPDITFEQFRNSGYPDLYITAVSLNRQRQLLFSTRTYPHMKIKDAIRITMSIPLYFEAICIDSCGRVIERPKTGSEYDLAVDGGITGNFPIQLFDSIVMINGERKRIPNRETLGVRIDSETQIEHDRNNNGLAPFEINTLGDYVSAFYAYVQESLNRHELNAGDWSRTISVSSVGISPKVGKLSQLQKNALMNSGRKSAQEFLARPH